MSLPAARPVPIIETPRLELRRWCQSDLEPFAAMNSDHRVMEFFPNALDRAQSDGLAARADAIFDKHPFGLFAVEVKGGEPFIGFVGLSPTTRERMPVPFTPCVEIGWRLAHRAWGQGYASESASACLDLGFSSGLDEIVSFTSVVNQRSQAVMRRIGMHRDPAGDFEHPSVAESDPLRQHVLYRLSASERHPTSEA